MVSLVGIDFMISFFFPLTVFFNIDSSCKGGGLLFVVSSELSYYYYYYY